MEDLPNTKKMGIECGRAREEFAEHHWHPEASDEWWRLYQEGWEEGWKLPEYTDEEFEDIFGFSR